MTRKQRIEELLSKKKRRTFEETEELKQLQNEFILKSKINRRLFDNSFEKVRKNKKYTGLNRRENGAKK